MSREQIYTPREDLQEHIFTYGRTMGALKDGGSISFVDGKGSMGNTFPKDWYRIEDKLVLKRGKSFYKDGNKLGKRKANFARPFLNNYMQ